MAEMTKPGTMPRPGVLLGGEHLLHSAKAVRLQTLTQRGITLARAELLAPMVWGGAANG